MPSLSSRPAISSLAHGRWDLLVVGGGIAGAGVFAEAARAGLRVLLVEQGDFASGTSSRSSKLVHGGLHYLARMEVGLALESIRERERLLRERPGLVDPLPFCLPIFEEPGGPRPWQVRLLLDAYWILRAAQGVPSWRPFTRRRRAPGGIGDPGIALGPGAIARYGYQDARTDDARLVLRVLREGVEAGGTAVNYVAALHPVSDPAGRVSGARIRDRESGASGVVHAGVVVNATGPWTDALRRRVGGEPRTRLIRGSHLVFPRRCLPIRQAVVSARPGTGDPVCFIPWRGCTLVGSTSIDHRTAPDHGVVISEGEARLLLADVRRVFPQLSLGPEHVISTFAGLRPVTDQTTHDPCRASRSRAIWEENGLVTVTAGKLTTYREGARRTLETCRGWLPRFRFADKGPAGALARNGPPATLEDRIRRGAREEGARRLEDLLLRRVRLGLLLPEGGLEHLSMIKAAAGEELGWDESRWRREVRNYRERLQTEYRLPPALTRAARSPIQVRPAKPAPPATLHAR